MRTVTIFIIAIFAVSCGDDDSMPTQPVMEPEPAPSIIGSWRNSGNNFSAKVIENVRKDLVSLGLSQEEIESTLQDDEFRFIFLENLEMIFRAGNSGTWEWPDGSGGKHTEQMQWSMQDGYLVIMAGSVIGGRFSYTVTSTRLTLSMTIEDFLVFLDDGSNSVSHEVLEDLSPEERREITAALQGITRIEYYFEKVQG